MIRNTVINIVNYFYPLGNTPPVSLTQDLPYGKDADILLLGCGDARNVLFSCFVDPSRKLDITCCDVEPAIVARNILLYTLLLDDTEDARLKQIWNIYYHWKLDDESLDLLENQIEKLVSLSKTASQWRESAYGSTIRFCDIRTVRQIHKLWNRYPSCGLTAAQLSRRQNTFHNNFERARKIRQKTLGDRQSYSGTRSAAPTGILALEDLSTVETRWWKEGITYSEKEPHLRPDHLNPAFLLSTNQNVTLHYGTNPLLGFPLATAYVPLLKNSCLYVGKEDTSSAEHLTACARQHFQNWARAFRKSISAGMVIRFCIADALAFSMSLRNAVPGEKEGILTANLFRDNWTFEPLELDKVEFETSSQRAPRLFDVIDTSNLIDHLGPLNLLPACAAILKDQVYSTMYTESLVQQDLNEKERVASLLGADIRAVALLLGLSPVETWTNATNSPEDESMLNALSTKKIGGSTQVRSRLRWKRTYSPDQTASRLNVHVEASQVAPLLVKLYRHMFEYEDAQSLFTSLTTNVISKRANPHYNRASFAILLKSMQRTMTTDWSQSLEQMMSQIVAGFSQLPYGANCAQELLLYMHIFGIDTSLLPPVELYASKDAKMAPFFKAWSHVPVQVCVTTRVPREKISLFTSRAAMTTGTPALRCDIEGGGVTSRPWSNSFAAVQIAFGDAQRSQHNGASELRIAEDDSNWWGSSDMFVSTFIPTWTILQSDETMPLVRCGLVSTPQSCAAFYKDLGLMLEIYSVALTSENVFISRYMPLMSGIPKLTPEEPPPHSEPNRTTHVSLSSDNTTVTSLSQKITCDSDGEMAKLSDRSLPVQVQFQDSMRALVKIGNELHYSVSFPVPVDQTRSKLRIARKSSFVEVEVPPWDPLRETSLCLVFPVAPPAMSPEKRFEPAPWTATQVRLDVLPVVDTKDKDKLSWLVTHGSTMFSTRERQIREDGMAGQTQPGQKPNNRVEMKEGLFSMLMTYTGLQGRPSNIFGLSKEVGGINVLFFPSSLRLDLINRTVVLDVAAIPLTNAMSADKKVRLFYQSLASQGVLQIKVSDEELRCWKSVIPAFVERCRLWKHTPNCEYAAKGEIPIVQGLEDGHSPLCSCGIGKFPIAYLKNLKVDHIEYVLETYATRAAISPFFPLPYLEDCFLAGLSIPETHTLASMIKGGCGNCGGVKRKNADSGKQELLVCSRCRKTKYCSEECQKADWKSHKGACMRA